MTNIHKLALEESLGRRHTVGLSGAIERRGDRQRDVVDVYSRQGSSLPGAIIR